VNKNTYQPLSNKTEKPLKGLAVSSGTLSMFKIQFLSTIMERIFLKNYHVITNN
jgi:hypothetical protein|tara:strand:+ start:1637 stop:1798 length:162 start_codon:yes stop_codon:yes gene_type:complete